MIHTTQAATPAQKVDKLFITILFIIKCLCQKTVEGKTSKEIFTHFCLFAHNVFGLQDQRFELKPQVQHFQQKEI